jgi:metal-sulfur cluster biosynthetic enzyme
MKDDPPPTPEAVRAALGAVIDPEMAIDIVSLGLVYGVQAQPGRIAVRLTMTSAACPVAELIVDDIAATLVRAYGEGVEVDVQLVWDPPWTPDMMSDRARHAMGW